ncbi:CopM family metallochaperone [Trinickia dabaoshanensis]
MQRTTKTGCSVLFVAALALGAAPLSALAATMASPSSTAEAQSAPAENQNADGDSTAAFKAADEHMMQSMQGEAYTGNADEDFVSRMIPHHQGAVDMAEVEAKYGKDPQLKRLAAQIIKSQRREIDFMKSWQAKHAHR